MGAIVKELKEKIVAGGGDATGVQTVSEALDKMPAGGGSTSELPAVTTDDNGKVLGVVEGAWGKVTPPAYTDLLFIHASYNEPVPDLPVAMVFDKTWTEVYDAAINGALIFVLIGEDGDEEHIFVPEHLKVMNIEVMHPEGSDDPLYSVSIKMPDPTGYIEVFFITDDPDGYPSWDGSV